MWFICTHFKWKYFSASSNLFSLLSPIIFLSIWQKERVSQRLWLVMLLLWLLVTKLFLYLICPRCGEENGCTYFWLANVSTLRMLLCLNIEPRNSLLFCFVDPFLKRYSLSWIMFPHLMQLYSFDLCFSVERMLQNFRHLSF